MKLNLSFLIIVPSISKLTRVVKFPLFTQSSGTKNAKFFA